MRAQSFVPAFLAALLAASPLTVSAQNTGQDTGQGVVERLEEYDIQAGPNGEIEGCGALPSRAPAGAPRAQIETALRAGLDHAQCINDHSIQATQGLVDLIAWVSQRAHLLNAAQETVAVQHINRIDGRVKASEAWKTAYFRDRLRPVVQDGNQRLGLDHDPIGRYLERQQQSQR